MKDRWLFVLTRSPIMSNIDLVSNSFIILQKLII